MIEKSPYIVHKDNSVDNFLVIERAFKIVWPELIIEALRVTKCGNQVDR